MPPQPRTSSPLRGSGPALAGLPSVHGALAGHTLAGAAPPGIAVCKQIAVPFRASGRQQPRVHGSGAVHEVADDATVPGRRLLREAPKSARSRSFAPTRSARAPPVVGPWQRRPESPAPPGARPACATCGTHATAIPPFEPGSRRARRSSLRSSFPRCSHRACALHARRGDRVARTMPGAQGFPCDDPAPSDDEKEDPGPLHPYLREEVAGSAAPEVPSVDGLLTCP